MNINGHKLGFLKLSNLKFPKWTALADAFDSYRKKRRATDHMDALAPFKVMVQKEIADHVRNWRFIILFAIIALACLGTLFSTLADGANTFAPDNSGNTFFFSEPVYQI